MESNNTKPTNAIVILDGFGYSPDPRGNAVAISGIPNISKLLERYPNGFLDAAGRAVGLPEGQMGNSEVGHLNLGAGRIVYQDITRIDKSIEDGDFFANPAFLGAINNVKAHGTALHLAGLCSDGGVHSHLNHLYALLELCKREKVKTVYIHCITDGRDVPPDSARRYVGEVVQKTKEFGVGSVASIVGRYYYMDRDNRWERVEKGYNGVFNGIGARYGDSDAAIAASYAAGEFDEFIKPLIIGGYAGVNPNDSMIFYNFRSDRAREISRAIIYPEFNSFERKGGFKLIYYVGMTQYDESFPQIQGSGVRGQGSVNKDEKFGVGIATAYAPKEIKNTLGEYLGKLGLTQARIAETEKYAHVTFFFNGGVEEPNPGEQRVLVPSPKVSTYDLKPEMSAYEVTEKALETIGTVDVLMLNFANCDMVGHTGILDVAVKAVTAVDECVARVAEKILSVHGNMILTADHGNAELMSFADGSPCTAHTTNLVRVMVVGEGFSKANITPCTVTGSPDTLPTRIRSGGNLGDVAPTLLEIMGLSKPVEMEGKSLLEK